MIILCSLSPRTEKIGGGKDFYFTAFLQRAQNFEIILFFALKAHLILYSSTQAVEFSHRVSLIVEEK